VLKVTPILGEVLRFRVQSESNPRRFYLVELDAHHNNGQCDCRDFQTRHGPMLKHDYQTKLRRRCKHCKAALLYFAERMLERIAAEYKANQVRR